MNTALLRLATKHKGVRRWRIPGFGNEAKLIPATGSSIAGWKGSFWWPDDEPDGQERMHGVDLGRHRAIAKAAAHKLTGR